MSTHLYLENDSMFAKNVLLLLIFVFAAIHNTFANELREVRLFIGTTFFCYYIYDPDVARLDGQNIKDNLFAPGEYELYLEHEGFHPLRKIVEIPAGEGGFCIRETLKPRKRPISFKVMYDIPMSSQEKLLDWQNPISFKLGVTPNSMHEVRTGSFLQPSNYYLEISKHGYETIKKSIIIPPGVAEYKFFEMLNAKKVHVDICVEYDVKPKSSKGLQITLVGVGNDIHIYNSQNNKLRPGNYTLEISQTGYVTIQKKIAIPVSERRYDIYETLVLVD